MTMDAGMIIQVVFSGGILGLIWRIHVAGQKTMEEKVAAVFKRFDQFKRDTKTDYVSKDVHKIVYEKMDRDIQEIKTDVKTLLRKNGFG